MTSGLGLALIEHLILAKVSLLLTSSPTVSARAGLRYPDCGSASAGMLSLCLAAAANHVGLALARSRSAARHAILVWPGVAWRSGCLGNASAA